MRRSLPQVGNGGPATPSPRSRGSTTGERRRVVLYNPRCVFWTMPLALLAVGSALDPAEIEVVIVDGRLEPDPLAALLRSIDARTVCLGITVLTGAPIADVLAVTRG